jgi:superfamily I DNA/RNA helicase
MERTMGEQAALMLDDAQRRAVTFSGSRLKLVGGPGTGKTTALVERAAALVAGGVEPDGVLLFVHDRKSAVRLRDRLVRRLGRSVAGPSVFTFHGFCWSLLTRGFPVTE